MLKRNWFRILLLISLGFEIYMLLTYNSTYSTMLHKENQSIIIFIFNLLYSTFVVACFYKKHCWSGLSILLLSCIRDLLLIPKGFYSPAFALADSTLCIMIMINVARIEYLRAEANHIFIPSWTEEDIQTRSEINNSFISCMTQKFYNYNTDPREAERKLKHRCKLCEYVQDNIKIGTQLRCAMCGKELDNEYISKLCPECAEKYNACIYCGGKMD
jgi:hypothetical protein